MSQKKDNIILLLSLLITLGLIGLGIWWFLNISGTKIDNISSETQKQQNTVSTNTSVNSNISFGEKLLIPGEAAITKKEAIAALKKTNYDEAIAKLDTALKAKPNDPEGLIYLNNARLKAQKSHIIATSIPIETDPNGSLEILRGIAQAQKEVNDKGGINGIPIKIAIANDENNPEAAQKIALELSKNQDVLGVIGSFSSDITLAAGKIYNSEKLVLISPTSTSVKLTNFSPYVFRTVPSDYIAARAAADYAVRKLQKNKIAVFFNSQSNYSQSLKSEFVTAVSLGGGQVTNEFDLSKSDFSPVKSYEQLTKQDTQVIMLATDTSSLDKALQVVQINQKRLPLLAGDSVYSLKTLEIGREQAVGMIVTISWHINGDYKSDFPQKSRQLWGADVNWRSAMSYDATLALIAAMARNPTRENIKQTLSSPDFSTQGASGTIRFLPSGDRNTSVQIVKIVPSQRLNVGYEFVPELP
jgi:branched-chain amino acid transport system substrate-binding protein